MIPFATFVQQLRKGCPVCSRTVRSQASAEAYSAALLQTEPDLRQDFAAPTALANYLRQEAKAGEPLLREFVAQYPDAGLDDTEEPRLVAFVAALESPTAPLLLADFEFALGRRLRAALIAASEQSDAIAARILRTDPAARAEFGNDPTLLAPLLRNHKAHSDGPLCFVSRATLNRAIQAAAPKPAPKPAAGGDDDEP